MQAIRLEIISVKDVSNEIRELYTLDPQFVSNYNIIDNTFENVVKHAIEQTQYAQEMFRIENNGNIVAIFGREDGDFIVPFFISPKYRHLKKDILELMLTKFNKPKIALAYSNTRAIKFFMVNNFYMASFIEKPVGRKYGIIILERG